MVLKTMERGIDVPNVVNAIKLIVQVATFGIEPAYTTLKHWQDCLLQFVTSFPIRLNNFLSPAVLPFEHGTVSKGGFSLYCVHLTFMKICQSAMYVSPPACEEKTERVHTQIVTLTSNVQKRK